MASTSPSELAQSLLNDCLAGRAWPVEQLERLMPSAELFSVLVEGLADRFEPRLCDVYAEMFAHVIERTIPELEASSMIAQYRAAREVRPVSVNPERVFVLSRVTWGADVAITSIILDACHKRFPKAERIFVGSKKAYELFETDARRAAQGAKHKGGG